MSVRCHSRTYTVTSVTAHSNTISAQATLNTEYELKALGDAGICISSQPVLPRHRDTVADHSLVAITSKLVLMWALNIGRIESRWRRVEFGCRDVAWEPELNRLDLAELEL